MTPALPTDEIRPLDQQHERAAFSCGDAKLDEYLRSYAGQNMQRRMAFVWVWTRPPSQVAIGYYTLTSTQIDAGILPPDVARKLKIRGSNALGATLLGRFAVGAAYQGQSLGTTLCMHALHKALEASKIVSSVGVVLDACADGAKAFWKKMEFIPLGERDGEMERFFLPMAYIEDLFR